MTDNDLTVAETLPQRINVTKVVTYDVQEMTKALYERGALEEGEQPTLDDLIWLLETHWLLDDFNKSDLRDLIFQDENGEEL